MNQFFPYLCWFFLIIFVFLYPFHVLIYFSFLFFILMIYFHLHLYLFIFLFSYSFQLSAFHDYSLSNCYQWIRKSVIVMRMNLKKHFPNLYLSDFLVIYFESAFILLFDLPRYCGLKNFFVQYLGLWIIMFKFLIYFFILKYFE